MTYVIAQPCIDIEDLACVEERPVDGIYEGVAVGGNGGARRS